MVPAFAGAAGFEYELSADVIWEIENLHRLGQEKLARLNPKRIVGRVAVQLDFLQL